MIVFIPQILDHTFWNMIVHAKRYDVEQTQLVRWIACDSEQWLDAVDFQY
jgi:hypothetical protein